MTLKDILLGGGGALLLLATMLQIAPIKINPWTWLARCIGKGINGEVLEALAATNKKLDKHIAQDDERHASNHRTRILRFADEELRGEHHSQEHFVEILADIDEYERYCENHPQYENNRAILAIKMIENTYARLLQNPNQFIG